MFSKRFKILNYNGLTPPQKIAISFMLVILVGTLLLMLPISNCDGKVFPFIDALFTSTSAVCVTGLVVAFPAIQFTLFGQIVLLLLIQIGGLGLMTLVATMILALRKRLSLQNKIAMLEMLNQSNMLNFKKFLFGILKYTFFFEGIGAILLCFSFIPDHGVSTGFFMSIFTSVSAFCNAGFDILGTQSLLPYAGDFLVNITVMALIIAGGLGFVVYFDLREKLPLLIKRKISFSVFLRRLMLQTKIVLVVSFILIVVPAFLFLLVEFDNPASLGAMDTPKSILVSFFSSVTLRTAGFATIDFGTFTLATQFLMLICMFIGGSPGGTSGGIKTTTIAVLILCVICNIRGKDKTVVFHRHISRDIIVRATIIVAINFAVLFIGIWLLLLTTNFSFMEIAFEAGSALATVGLSLGITASLPFFAKIVIIVLMFVGRIGIVTFLVSLMKKEPREVIDYAEGHIMIG